MAIDAELASMGEPPVNAAEKTLIGLLDQLLALRARGETARAEELLSAAPELAREGAALVHAAECIEALIASVLEQSHVEYADAMTIDWAKEDSIDADADLPDPLPGQYRIRRLLGEGRFGRVWLADHLRLDIPVALKTLHIHVAVKERAAVLATLENEARILARLQHPNIVRVYGLEQAGDTSYLVMQYVDGGSLQRRLDQDSPLGWQRAARYIADVGEALLHVHAAGIVHRDIKPANLLWDRRRDEALLTDFGVATRLADARQVAGTPLFMAPEAFSGRSTPASDVYGLAASLFTLVAGRVPFPAATSDELLERIRRGLPETEPLFAAVPERLERVMRAGLAAMPEQRPALGTFVADLRGSLNRLLADSLIRPAAPVQLRLTVGRQVGANQYVPVAGRQPQPRGVTRNMTRVPPQPDCVVLHTGDRVRVEVVAHRDGFFTVFNVGPTGQLNLLYPEPDGPSVLVRANEPLHVTDVAMTPPVGNERLFAVWSRAPLPLDQAVALTRGEVDAVSPSYRATRNMERVQQSVQQLGRDDWHAVVLELDHVA